MKRKDFEKLNLIKKTDRGEDDINPLTEIGHAYFDSASNPDYRNDAINTCIAKNLSFTTDCNYIYDMMKRFVKVKCPKCGKILSSRGGSGNSSLYNINFLCDDECKTEVSIAVPPDGISVTMFK